MRILFLSAANSIHTVRWVNALAKRGHEVHLVYNEGHDPECDKIDGRIELHSLKYSGAKGYYLNAVALKKLTRNVRPDVINVHYASGYGTLARRSKIGPYLLSIWGSDVYDFPYHGKINKYILRKNVENAKILASTSECMANQLRKVLEKPTLEIGITPFGVDLERFKMEGVPMKEDGTILIGNIKTLEPVYRIEDLINATRVLKNNLENKQLSDISNKIRVHIYGDGRLRGELEQLICKLSLEDTVYLKGRIPNEDVPDILNKFDVFCATSEKESFGVSVVEAMAMEIPVVVSDAEGFKEVVEDTKNGFVVPCGNIKVIAEKLERLVLDVRLREQFGKEGRKRVEKLYEWEKNVDTMEKLYKQLRELKKEKNYETNIIEKN